MKRFAAAVICVILLLGCGKIHNGMDGAISFRQRLVSSEQCRFDCMITADYGSQIYTFSMECSFDNSGTMTFCVQQPESIQGISGKIEAGNGLLTFDDQALSFPLLADGYLSPVSAPWFFVKALRGGYIHSCTLTEEGYQLTLNDSYEERPLQLTIWTDEDYSPNSCEFLWDGRRILSLVVRNFSCM